VRVVGGGKEIGASSFFWDLISFLFLLFYYFLKISLKKNKIFFNNLFAMSQCVCMVHPLKGVHVSFPFMSL